MIASAVSDLFARLPQQLQTRFADVPRVIKRLESEAEALRKRPEGHRTDERLATAVAALESLRLDMLRLEAGVGTADDLTADLERAGAISEAVDAEVRAVNEVESIVRGARPNVPHPADQTS